MKRKKILGALLGLSILAIVASTSVSLKAEQDWTGWTETISGNTFCEKPGRTCHPPIIITPN